MYMTREASWFYLSRTLPFLSYTELARELSITRLTLDRWVTRGRLPLKAQDNFEKVLDKLHDRWGKAARDAGVPSYYDDLQKAMLDREPRHLEAPMEPRREDEFIAKLKPLLKKGMPSRDVMDLGAEYGLPNHTIYRISNELGVHKDVRGKGRKQKSTWYL